MNQKNIFKNRYGRELLMTAAVLALAAAGLVWLYWLGKKPERKPAPVTRVASAEKPRSAPVSETPETLTDDRDRQKYRTVKIGNKVWMAENLNYLTGNSWCYDNDDFNCGKYGRLYDWNTAKGACPQGWHLPTRQEWLKLVTTAGGSSNAGRNLKAKSGWDNSGNGTDYYRVSILPGGYRDTGGNFKNIGTDGTYWAGTELDCCDGIAAYSRYMDSGFDDATDAKNYKRVGLSVRCVTDSNTFRDPRDEKTYMTTTIGNQIWMAENLNYKTDGSWCYSDTGLMCDIYGRLYDWNAANSACPPGWHLPLGKDWDSLARAVGGEPEYNIDKKTLSWDNVNGKLRAESGWDTRFRVDWRDEYDFSALPSGRRKSNGTFDPVYGDGWSEWWTAEMSGIDSAFIRRVSYYRDYMDPDRIDKSEGVSVRCVRDD
jgi:uncharacterized protein (TIGR02145 family)